MVSFLSLPEFWKGGGYHPKGQAGQSAHLRAMAFLRRFLHAHLRIFYEGLNYEGELVVRIHHTKPSFLSYVPLSCMLRTRVCLILHCAYRTSSAFPRPVLDRMFGWNLACVAAGDYRFTPRHDRLPARVSTPCKIVQGFPLVADCLCLKMDHRRFDCESRPWPMALFLIGVSVRWYSCRDRTRRLLYQRP